MKTTINLIAVVLLLAGAALMTGCTDDRTAPTQTNDPVYSQTIELFSKRPAAGADVSAAFTVRDSVVDARLLVSGFIRPDGGMAMFLRLGDELDSLTDRINGLDALIIPLDLKANKTAADSAALDSLSLLKTTSIEQVQMREETRDSLDTRLDGRFKVSIWLDGDVTELYPRAIYLDSAAVPTHLHTGEEVVWGQGFYLAQADTGGVHGKTMRLDLKRMMVADATYRHPSKPGRPANPDLLPELFPVTDWLSRLTPGSHTLHVRFGEAGTETQVSASLYFVYKRAG